MIQGKGRLSPKGPPGKANDKSNCESEEKSETASPREGQYLPWIERRRASCGASVAGNISLHKCRLEILLRPLVNAVQRLLQVLQRISHAEAQVAFAKVTECGTGECRNSCLLEQSICQRLRFPSRLRDVGKDVECAFWHAAGKALDLIQPGYKHIAAAFEFRAHLIHRTLIAPQAFDPGHLREAGSAGVGVRHQARDVCRQIGAHYAVTHAPSRHGISLRESIEQDGTF